MREPGLFENYCSCPDFAINTLGTSKRIEALLFALRKRHGQTLERKSYTRSRAFIALQYWEQSEILGGLMRNGSAGAGFRKSTCGALEEVFADQPGRPKRLIEQEAPKAVPVRPSAIAAADQPAKFKQAAA